MIGMGKRGPIEKASEGGWAREGRGCWSGEQKVGTRHCQGRGQTEEGDLSPLVLFACLRCRASHPFTAIASLRLYDYRSFKRDKRWEHWQYEAERL